MANPANILVTDLADLDTTLVQDAALLLSSLVQEAHPELDLRRGAIHDLLIQPSAALAVKNQVEQDRQRRSTSLAAIQVDPSLADDTMVSNLCATLGVSRRASSNATGTVAIVVNSWAETTIPVGFRFEYQGLAFVTATSFTARKSAADLVTTFDRLLVSTGNSQWVFTIEVVAAEAGSAGLLRKDALLVPQSAFLGFVTAYAAEDFTSGADAEDNVELVARLAAGITAKTFSGRDSMRALLYSRFPDLVTDSFLGLGSAELLRDKHSLFPGSTGGCLDWYVRTASLPSQVSAIKEAVLVEKTDDGYGIWQMTFDRDEAAGLYHVTKIVPQGSGPTVGTYAITEDIRGLDLTALADSDGFIPDIVTVEEGVYSRFQTVIVRFKDTQTNTALLTIQQSTANYGVTALQMPTIAEIQDFVLDPGTRNPGGDCLIKAPVPCFLSLSFTLRLRAGQASPDTAAMAAEIARRINLLGFTQRLPASLVLSVIHEYLAVGASADSLDMLGRIRRPDGTWSQLRSADVLEIPDDPARMLTARTTAWYVVPEDIAITTIVTAASL